MAPRPAAESIMPGDAPLVPREKRAEVYAMDNVQKANRKYMGEPPGEIVS